MCTLIVSLGNPRWPLIIAANRDEALNRPASGPKLWPQGFVAPRDEQAGGTWLGVTPRGHFVGLTNRFLAAKEPHKPSRGQLVVDALGTGGRAQLDRWLTPELAGRYAAFHLVSADLEGAEVYWQDEGVLQTRTLTQPLEIFTERSFRPEPSAREAVIKEEWAVLERGAEGAPTPGAVQRLLGLTRDDPFESVCVYAPDFNYGTRSSFILYRGRTWAESLLYICDGRPDQVPFVEREDLRSALA